MTDVRGSLIPTTQLASAELVVVRVDGFTAPEEDVIPAGIIDPWFHEGTTFGEGADFEVGGTFHQAGLQVSQELGSVTAVDFNRAHVRRSGFGTRV